MGERFLGIDFSGGAEPWKTRCSKPTVWIATLDGGQLDDLRPVQDLAGAGEPFERLAALLAAGDFRAASIDAPFSLPARHVPKGLHRELLVRIAAMPPAGDRPFPRGQALYNLAQSTQPYDPNVKVWRETEAACGALARSTLWHGENGDGVTGRPGTPFTVACLALLAKADSPIWPWRNSGGMLVEAFPMAQLKSWNLPYRGYADLPPKKATQNAVEAVGAARRAILVGIERRVSIPDHLRSLMLNSPDALDSVVAAFGGMAAASGNLRFPLPKSWKIEGAIAVHPD